MIKYILIIAFIVSTTGLVGCGDDSGNLASANTAASEPGGNIGGGIMHGLTEIWGFLGGEV